MPDLTPIVITMMPKTFTSTQRPIIAGKKPYILTDGSNILGSVSYISKNNRKITAKILNDGITLIDANKRVYTHPIHFMDVCEGVENPRIYIQAPDFNKKKKLLFIYILFITVFLFIFK
jgi:hypothetical protein